jgi:hypothetical protein
VDNGLGRRIWETEEAPALLDEGDRAARKRELSWLRLVKAGVTPPNFGDQRENLLL